MQQFFSSLSRPVAFFLVILAVLALFMFIEILPLHFGDRHLAWYATGIELWQRLPRMLAIGGAIAFFLVLQGPKKGNGKPETKDQSSL